MDAKWIERAGSAVEIQIASRIYRPASSTTLRSARLIRVWYPRPCFLNQASTSASSRSVTGFLIGLYISPNSAEEPRQFLRSAADAFRFILFLPALRLPVTLALRFICAVYTHSPIHTILPVQYVPCGTSVDILAQTFRMPARLHSNDVSWWL